MGSHSTKCHFLSGRLLISARLFLSFVFDFEIHSATPMGRLYGYCFSIIYTPVLSFMCVVSSMVGRKGARFSQGQDEEVVVSASSLT